MTNKLTTKQYNISWLRRSIDNTYDLMTGAMNRICVTDDDAERDRMAEAIAHYTEKLIELTKCRNNDYKNLDEIHDKYTPKSSDIKLNI